MVGSGRRMGGKILRGASKEIRPMGGQNNQGGMPPSNPWLHKTKAFRPTPRLGKPGAFGFEKMNITNQKTVLRSKRKKNKWNGKIEKKTPPSIFLIGKIIRD